MKTYFLSIVVLCLMSCNNVEQKEDAQESVPNFNLDVNNVVSVKVSDELKNALNVLASSEQMLITECNSKVSQKRDTITTKFFYEIEKNRQNLTIVKYCKGDAECGYIQESERYVIPIKSIGKIDFLDGSIKPFYDADFRGFFNLTIYAKNNEKLFQEKIVHKSIDKSGAIVYDEINDYTISNGLGNYIQQENAANIRYAINRLVQEFQ